MIQPSVAERPTAAQATSLVTPPQDNAHNSGLTSCPHSLLIQERCSHGNHRWIRVPCNKWSCEHCGQVRLWQELLPEIRLAYQYAMARGWTLKFDTLTWQEADNGAIPGRMGGRRRRLDIQHLKQTFKRQSTYFEYLRVAEYHAAGTVHVHMLVVSPYIDQTHFSKTWARHAGGSFIVHTEAVGFKCPRCWDSHEKDPRIRKRRIIVLKPGAQEALCPTCSFSVGADDATERTLKAALYETAKYLVKTPLGKLTRSKGWQSYHREALAMNKPKGRSAPCTECPKPHRFVWWPEHYALDLYPHEEIEIVIGGPGQPSEHGNCNCFEPNTDLDLYLSLYPPLTFVLTPPA